EHVLDASAEFAGRLLQRCPGLTLLATSREPLRIPGEVVWHVPSLAIPGSELDRLPVKDSDIPAFVGQNPALRLFCERARAVHPAFTLNGSGLRALVDICCRLDGIPLAIELAAARMSALSVEQIAARLDDRFQLLTGGSRAALPRQQTLRATLDWSYELLSGPERTLLRRLSVFSGGFTLEAD